MSVWVRGSGCRRGVWARRCVCVGVGVSLKKYVLCVCVYYKKQFFSKKMFFKV